MGTSGKWLDCTSLDYIVMDAMGAILEGVEVARETEDGIEVICFAVTAEGEELLCTSDGVYFEPVRARMDIPGGMINQYED